MKKNINIETQIRSMTKILDDLRQGIIQVPQFQREFVWERSNIRELFDSIKNNYPIGSILLWKPRERKEWKSKKMGSYTLPTVEGSQIFVLDGYQRLSSLFGCLTNPNKAGLEYDENLYSDFFELYYDLDDESFIYMGGRTPKPWQVPVYILMSTMDFRQYSRKTIEPNVDENRLEHYLDRADAFSRSLVDYKIAVIEVTNAELDDAVEIFSRINSKGTEISPDWMVNALSYNDNFSFALEIDNLQMRLRKYNFDGISRTALFRCYQSAFDDKMYIDQSEIEKLAKRADFAEVVKQTTPVIEKAIRFLYNELNVIDNRLLPYNTQLVFLMTFFKKISNPSNIQLKELKRWFWITSYSNYFTIYSLTHQRNAFAQFIDYLEGRNNEIVYMDNGKQKYTTLLLPEKISLASVRCRSLLLFELNHYREITGAVPQTGGLNLKKISMKREATPSNTVPFFGSEKKLRWTAYDLPTYIETDNRLNNAFFIPQGYSSIGDNEDELDAFLKKRLELLSGAEKTFVEGFGLKYGVDKPVLLPI